jgi:phospholipid/cholesterol/gamma-HCH transport system substrate-binding protein
MKWSNEAKIGAFVGTSLLVAGAFAWAIGVQNPFQSSLRFYVTYNFAGGIEVGSPVRVSGIKVGKVERIDFFTPKAGQVIGLREPGSAGEAEGSTTALAPVRLRISVRNDAAVGVREDSRFYINLAGIIGERYVEITPGTLESRQLQGGELMAGVDPPRIDQLLSQSFDLAGKIKELIEANKGDLSRSIELLYKLSGNLNRTLAWVDKSAVFKSDLSKLVSNLIAITSDLQTVTRRVNSPEADKTLKLMYELLWRLEPLNEKSIHEFLQREGVRIKVF